MSLLIFISTRIRPRSSRFSGRHGVAGDSSTTGDGIVRCLAKTCLLQVGTASGSLIHPFTTTGLFINSIACLFTRVLANSIDRLTTHSLIHPFTTTCLFINSIACLFTRLLANSIDRLTTYLLTPCITFSLNYFFRLLP